MHADEPRPGLSFTDEIILRGIRDGRRDPEIAVSLGISTADVKRRVERLVREAHLAARSDLAVWDPATSPEPEPELPAEASAGRRRIPVFAAAGLALAALLAAGAVAWFVTRGPDRNGDASPASVRASADEVASPGTSGIPATRLRFAPAGPFPEDLLLYVVRGCEGCRSPLALDRVYRDQYGDVRTEALFRVDPSSGRHILSVWAQRDAAQIVVAVCDAGSCGAAGEPSSDAFTRFYRSRDGGITWADIGAVAGVAETLSVSNRDLVLVRVEQDGVTRFEVVGSDVHVDPAPLIPQGPPAEFTLLAQLDAETIQGMSRITINANGVFAYSWYPYSGSPDADGVSTRLGIADRWGNTSAMFEYVGAPLALGAWLDAHTVTATVTLPPGVETVERDPAVPGMHMPVLIDVLRGTVTALPEPFTNQRYRSATSTVVAALRGPFLRIAGLRGDCLPVLVAPQRAAREAACLVEGALVTVHESRVLVSEEWTGVRAPGGEIGWIRPEDFDALGIVN
jgi:hypothetical protein